MRFCPVCDGFEAMDERVGVVRRLAHVVRKALFLRTYTDKVTLLVTDKIINFTAEDHAALVQANIQIPTQPVVDLIVSEKIVKATLASGSEIELDIVYPTMGTQVRSALARNLGARIDEQGYLFVDSHQETSVPGLYAAGDVTIELSQISVAAGQAAIAATHIHNNLPSNFR